MIRLPFAFDQRPVASLVLAGAISVSSLGGVLLSDQMRNEALSALSAARNQHARLSDELASEHALAQHLKPALIQWQALASRGALQPPAPAIWSAEISRILASQGITIVPPRFGAPRLLQGTSDTASPHLMAHGIELDLPLRHEGRLLPLLEALTSLRGARVLPRACTLTRRSDDAVDRIQVRCQLDWLTIALPAGSPQR
jgi:hypothetical protein